MEINKGDSPKLVNTMKKIIAIAYTAFAAFGFAAGYLSNSGPLDYIFVIIAGIPWTQILSWAFPSSGTPVIAIIGVLINLALVWWWALRKRART
ncbi:MAG TPA: hypothetical protein PKE66_00040 [Pyrinomonadaceae bacterium]|nr:hypothetical protein [Pyrinomonadaceae bacterium]